MGRRISGGDVSFVVTFPEYASKATVAPPLNTASNFKLSTIGNKKPPWAAFAHEGFHKLLAVP